MKTLSIHLLLVFCLLSCKGQQPFGTQYLKLEKEIAMHEVSGRIDHMAINLKERILYLAALGNNSIEVVDLKEGQVIKSIKGIKEPQGVAFIPETNELVIASGGNGDCVFFNASSFERVATIQLAGDADNIRYQASSHRIYVGFGNGGIAEIDSKKHVLLRQIKLNAHPESFQIDPQNDRMFINLPDAHSVAIVRLSDMKLIDTWKIKNEKANFPMTLDTLNHRVFIGYRRPAVLVSYDGKTGAVLSQVNLVDDVDDIFYDHHTKEILASGGGGFINIFKTENNSAVKQIANIVTQDGARTSLLIPSLQTFILAKRASGGQPAAIAFYKLSD